MKYTQFNKYKHQTISPIFRFKDCDRDNVVVVKHKTFWILFSLGRSDASSSSASANNI